MGYLSTEFFQPQTANYLSHHGSMVVGAPEWGSMRLWTNDLPIDKVTVAPLPEDTRNEEIVVFLKPDLIYTPDPTKTKADRQVVREENVGGKA